MSFGENTLKKMSLEIPSRNHHCYDLVTLLISGLSYVSLAGVATYLLIALFSVAPTTSGSVCVLINVSSSQIPSWKQFHSDEISEAISFNCIQESCSRLVEATIISLPSMYKYKQND